MYESYERMYWNSYLRNDFALLKEIKSVHVIVIDI